MSTLTPEAIERAMIDVDMAGFGEDGRMISDYTLRYAPDLAGTVTTLLSVPATDDSRVNVMVGAANFYSIRPVADPTMPEGSWVLEERGRTVRK